MHTRQCSALRRVVSCKAFSSGELLQVQDKRSTCKRARTSSWYSEMRLYYYLKLRLDL